MTATEPTTTGATNLDHTREAWLRVATARMAAEIEEVSGIVLPDVRVSMGFGGRRYERGVAGVCWHRKADAEGLNQIFISPEISDMIRDEKGVLRPAKGAEVGLIPATVIVLLSLRHELIHAALDNQGGHGTKANKAKGIEEDQRFPEYATRLGFDAPFAYLTPSPALIDEMTFLALELGDFPHATLTVKAEVPVNAPAGGGGTITITSAGGSDVNRWISFYCPNHASPVRMSSKKAARSLLVCLELDHETGTPCMQPLTRGK